MMKNKIRQILREETSGFDDKTLKALYQFMNFLTKDYKWYYDTPKNRFEHSAGSIWLINPKTKEWVFFLTKSGELWWNWDFYLIFKRYFNMEKSVYGEFFIKIWAEDVLNRRVSTKKRPREGYREWIEDVLKNGKELK
jgi:hypothetical protein